MSALAVALPFLGYWSVVLLLDWRRVRANALAKARGEQ